MPKKTSPKPPSELRHSLPEVVHLPPGTLCLNVDEMWLVVGRNRMIILTGPSTGGLSHMSTSRRGWHETWEFLEP